MTKYDKLVRDLIPSIILADGKTPTTHITNDEDYLNWLKDKLQEEVTKFLESDNPEELADILEVIYAICDDKGIELAELEVARRNKSKERGGFKQKIILTEVKED